MILKIYTTNNISEIQESVPVNYLNVFLTNPFLYEGAPVKIQLEEDNKVLGGVYAFPMQIVYNGNIVYTACAGSTLEVIPANRGMGLAKKMTEKRLEITKDKIAIASGLSNMSLPLFNKLGFDIFMSTRNIFLKNTRPVLEIFIKNKRLLFFITNVLNILVSFIDVIMKIQKKSIFRGIQIEEVFETPIEVAEIVSNDTAMFRENHTKEWFDWILKSKFNDDFRSKQRLFVVRENSEIIGFFMTKERFYEQASHRGFKNIILGSIIEWGVKNNKKIKDEQLLLCGLLSFGKHVDAVEVCTPYDNLNKYLRRHFLVPVGMSNFAIKAGENSPLTKYPGYHKITNWRIRPAASDNSFN